MEDQTQNPTAPVADDGAQGGAQAPQTDAPQTEAPAAPEEGTDTVSSSDA